MQRNTLRSIVRFLFNHLTHMKVTGLENVPLQGACLLPTNHLGLLDAPLVFALVERDDVTALVADKHKKNLFFHWAIETVHGIWINREEADFHALREALNFLKKGGALGIAPEGTRSRTGKLNHAKSGVAYLADKSGAPIIPVAVYGAEKPVNGLLLHGHFPYIHIQFGTPFHLPPLDRHNREQSMEHNTDEIMCRIAAMLPAAYRGVYADHPRVKEILEQQEQADEPAETLA